MSLIIPGAGGMYAYAQYKKGNVVLAGAAGFVSVIVLAATLGLT